MLVDHVRLDRQPYEACPRAFSSACPSSSRHAAGRCECAVENEFSLARRDGNGYTPIDTSVCFSTVGMTAAGEVVDALVDALERQAIPLEQYYPELGHGQQEISVSHRPAIAAADTQVLVRETIPRGRHGASVSSLRSAKPWSDQAGNGAHIHLSLWDTATGAEPVL